MLNIVTLKSRLGVTQKSLEMALFKRLYGFIFALHTNQGSNLHDFGDKARYWSKIVIFFIPPCTGRPRYGVAIVVLPSHLVWKN